MQKECDRVRGTHPLETAEGETCQDAERKGLSKGTHPLGSTDGGTRKDTEGECVSEGATGLSEGNELWTAEGGGQVRTRKESDQLRGTYPLGTADRGTSQGTERQRPGEEHSRAGNHRGRDERRKESGSTHKLGKLSIGPDARPNGVDDNGT